LAADLKVDESVYVPCSRVRGLESVGVALFQTKVVESAKKKVRVQLRDGSPSDWIGAALVHRAVGILIVNIGDFYSEHSLLDPLAKSVGQFCRLLVPVDQIRAVRVRSLSELTCFWQREQAAYSHVIWIGHGSPNGIHFAVDGLVSPDQLNVALQFRGAENKVFVSLCCQTGYQSFGAAISRSTICRTFLGPFHSVEGAIASQFCQTFLVSHLLQGVTVAAAFRAAREAVPGSASFRLWKNGQLTAGPR
jgi:hypothetical protein